VARSYMGSQHVVQAYANENRTAPILNSSVRPSTSWERRPFMPTGEWMAIRPRSVRDATDGRTSAPLPRTRARQPFCADCGWDPMTADRTIVLGIFQFRDQLDEICDVHLVARYCAELWQRCGDPKFQCGWSQSCGSCGRNHGKAPMHRGRQRATSEALRAGLG
jgi:hypothetical protein